MQRLIFLWVVLVFVVLASGQLPCAAQGDDVPRPTAWGELRKFGSAYGRSYSAVIKDRPADGRLIFPADLESVFVAGMRMARGPAATDGGETSTVFVHLPLEFDPSTGALTIPLPEDAGSGPGSAALLSATDRTSQTTNRIMFPAQSARVDGKTAKLESTGSHHRIGFWTDPADRILWDYTATRWGRYEVFFTYSTASPDGGAATIAMGGESLDVELPSTGSWYRYETISAGKLYLKTEGKHELSVAAKKLTGPALMNLKAVWLEPTAESDARLVQADDGSITLHARDARISGTKLRYEPKPEKNTLGYWTNAGDSAQWQFEVRKPGTFDIEVLQGCGTGQGGSTMKVWGTGIEIFEFRVEETGHFQNFVPRIVGRARIDRAGPASLTILPKHIAKAAACDIRQIRLIPVKAEPADTNDNP
jgi:hypothetical protein